MSIKSITRGSAVLGLALAMMGWCASALASQKYGVFERVLEASGSFAQTNKALEKSIAASHLVLHATDNIAVPHNIQQARVYILTSPTYENVAKDMPPDTVSAQILRVAVYTYGPGKKTQIDMANPVALAMVYYAKSKEYPQMLAAAKAASQEIMNVVDKVPGTPVAKQLAPLRSESDLNSFDGDGPAKMMADWDNWRESQDTVYKAKPANFAATVAKVAAALNASSKGASNPDNSSAWHIVSEIPVGTNAVWFGIDNAYTQNKCIRINSQFRSRGKTKDAPYPGVDHAPALPLEVLVINNGKRVQVAQYGEMWRMQLYFWDSGYLAFATNTLIPSTIYGSIKNALTATVASK
ncbi:MAG: hypothetical protein M0Z84_13860 [Gammaproteobacteria bacterium]|nr:hypothetical protein [Gammaproteobacteria bacterium]